MPRLFPLLLVFPAAGPASAADPKPNTLTPKEAGLGWVLLFDGETTFGWTVDGAAEVKDGALILGKGKKTVAYPLAGFGDRFEYRLEARGAGAVVSRRGRTDFSGRADGRWGTVIYVQSPGESSGTADGLGKSRSSYGVESDRPELAVAPFVIETDGEHPVEVRSVKLLPAGMKPLFSGKDLTGWKLFAGDPKRMASKAEVTAVGELSLTNGPGDLQTEAEYADFVLQLECKTNGKGLNSGVFFRCLPGQYQQGYEAQIQNSYLGDDRTKPLDFGTGAIYRRVPARKVVSDDGEWFTLTVAANGPRISTWVNGYPTVSWLDDRKPADNARQGLKTGKGHISLQGHDPTTDLLFRNVRIVELPGPAKR
ncbi:MAG: DUF1080 domain-containing protein [Gemmataceae bacterium]|nr:DUF1080 domain-containing protein [Gemmataceae bacterium]